MSQVSQLTVGFGQFCFVEPRSILDCGLDVRIEGAKFPYLWFVSLGTPLNLTMAKCVSQGLQLLFFTFSAV